MTKIKKIENITPRAVGDIFNVAYLSDLSAMNSAISAIIGDFEGDGTIVRKGSDITQTLVNIDAALTDAMNTLGYVLGDSTAAGYYISPDYTVYENLSALDSAIGEIPTDGQYITSSNATNVGAALAVLDTALYNVETSHIALYANVANALGTQLVADDDGGWYMSFAGSYVGGTSNVGDAIEALDSELVNVVTDHGELVEAMGLAYDGDGNWNFTTLDNYPEVLTSASNATEAFVDLGFAIESAQEAGEVTISSATGSGNVATVYTIYQGGSALSNVVGTINIPKDFLVKSAALSTVTTANIPYQGAHVGDKYIDFVINTREGTGTAEHIYLPVNDLVDVYTAQQNATQVQLAIDSSNVISATIVDSAVTTAKIANSAVTTAKIADGAINSSKIKLIDTATTGDYVGKAYTLQVTNGRLQVKELPSQVTN